MRIRSFAILFMAVVAGCGSTKGAQWPSAVNRSAALAAPARAPMDPELLKVASGLHKDPAEIDQILTRGQKIVYGSNYVDFYATLHTPNNRSQTARKEQTCFSIRIETDDSRVNSALKWDAYLRRAGYAHARLYFSSYVFEPEPQYPLVYKAEACAPYAITTQDPISLIVHALFKRGLDDIRLEWTFSK